MKKLIIVTLIAFSLNACRYVNTTEPYVQAHTSPKLTIPEGVDSPNSSSTLEIPEAAKKVEIYEKSKVRPPEMPIRTQQSEDGKKAIENDKGLAVLSVKTIVAEAWKAMNLLTIENWEIKSGDESQCTIVLHYSDKDARDREKSNFLKKIFTRNKYYTDYTGDFNLSCKQFGSRVKITFKQTDGNAAKSFLADNVMNKLYALFN